MNRPQVQVILIFSLLIFSQIRSSAQPDYVFKNAALESGTALTLGAKYRFPNVKTGIDALVTITNVTGGITLTSIDEGWTGYDEAFQPFINVASSSNGYVEFKIDFVATGTATLVNQAYVPATCVDVDGYNYGNGILYEKDQVEYINGYYDFNMVGLNLQVLNPPGWITMRNTSGVSYPGIDTSAKDVMVTVVNSNISSFKVRIGAQNSSPTKSEIRYRSVYFMRFTYSTSILLPNRTLLSFSGAEKSGKIELKGKLSASHTYDKIVVERSTGGTAFEQIGVVPITNGGSSEFPFTFLDPLPNSGANFYRVKLVNTPQAIFEVSNTLMIKTYTDDLKGLTLYNTMLKASDPAVTLQSKQDADLGLEVIDMSGRRVFSKNTKLSKGVNVVDLSNFNGGRGYFILVARTGQETMSQKIIIQ